jgi:hypothetical protein
MAENENWRPTFVESLPYRIKKKRSTNGLGSDTRTQADGHDLYIGRSISIYFTQ